MTAPIAARTAGGRVRPRPDGPFGGTAITSAIPSWLAGAALALFAAAVPSAAQAPAGPAPVTAAKPSPKPFARPQPASDAVRVEAEVGGGNAGGGSRKAAAQWRRYRNPPPRAGPTVSPRASARPAPPSRSRGTRRRACPWPSGGLGITLADLARLYAGVARGWSVPDIARRADDVGGPRHEPRRLVGPVASWYVADILRGTLPPENALPNRIACKTGTSLRLPGRLGRRVRQARDGGRLGRSPGRRRRPRPRREDSGGPRPVRRLRTAGRRAGTAALPPPLRRLGRDGGGAAGSLRIAYPPDGARIDVGLAEGGPSGLALKALGGTLPLTWMVNGMPVPEADMRQAEWWPDGAGFARVSVMDATGAGDSVFVRLE